MKKLLTFFAITSFTAVFSQITINANLPSSANAGSEIETDVKIAKGTVGNFAKYQMDVPAGVTVSSIDVKSGNFTFENQRAKIVWVSVPSEAEFTIKLKVNISSTAPNPSTFSQKFYYLENNEKKEVEATPVIVSLNGGSAVATTPTETKPVESKPVETVASTPVESKPVETVASTPVESKPVETVASTPVESKPVETKAEPATTTSTSAKKNTSSSVSESGMTYKVQIGAYSSEPRKSKYGNLSNLSIDLVNGMYKVTTGKFTSKEEAIKYRDELEAKGYNGGFIAKYKDGVRIN